MEIIFKGAFGWEFAVKGMRRSRDSQVYSDSDFTKVILGEKDLKLMQQLVLAGNDHSKFMRLIVAYFDIKAPRYWWQQLDTYRMGVERCSDSTMHTIMKRKLVQEDFEEAILPEHLQYLNNLIVDAKDEKNEELKQVYFRRLKVNLPESFLQGRTVMFSYQALRSIYWARKNHRLEEWKYFCERISEEVPYSKELICIK